MIYTLFFSRLHAMAPEVEADYGRRQADLVARARAEHPGFVDTKTFVAEDGERLTVVRFRDEASQRAWRNDAAHVVAQRRGRTHFYDSYRIVVCEELHSHAWSRAGSAAERRSDVAVAGIAGVPRADASSRTTADASPRTTADATGTEGA